MVKLIYTINEQSFHSNKTINTKRHRENSNLSHQLRSKTTNPMLTC